MMDNIQKSAAEQINRKTWWHSRPIDPDAYGKRGIFLAWSYNDCLFYGRPLDSPFRVNVNNPMIGTEEDVIINLFGFNSKIHLLKLNIENKPIECRFDLDAKMYRAARKKGFDAIAIISEIGYKRYKATGKIPRAMELNILDDDFEKNCKAIE